MPPPFVAPEFMADAFNCPFCEAYANQVWFQVHKSRIKDGGSAISGVQDFRIARCTHCGRELVWREDEMIYPDTTGVESANPDLDDGIRADYDEAARIVDRSPRGAAALLRLAIQKTCKQLGQPGRSINEDIKALVEAGTIPDMVQQALDVVRVVGNNAVHPGELDIRDDRQTAVEMFKLVNLIADIAITQPLKVQSLYESLPQGARDAIDRRDGRDGRSAAP